MVTRKLELRDLKTWTIKVNIRKQVQMLHVHCYLLSDITRLKSLIIFMCIGKWWNLPNTSEEAKSRSQVLLKFQAFDSIAWNMKNGLNWLFRKVINNSTDGGYYKYAGTDIQVLDYSKTTVNHRWPRKFKRLQPSYNVRKPQALFSCVWVIFVAIGYTN